MPDGFVTANGRPINGRVPSSTIIAETAWAVRAAIIDEHLEAMLHRDWLEVCNRLDWIAVTFAVLTNSLVTVFMFV